MQAKSSSPSAAEAAEVEIAAAPAARPGRLRALASGLIPYQIAFFVLVLLQWEVVSYLFGLEFWVSNPSSIATSLARWYESGLLGSDLRITLFEAAFGFLIGSAFGGSMGFLLGWVRQLGNFLEPFVLALYTVPKIALAPLFVLWFGIGPMNKVMFSSLLVALMVFITTFQGVRQVDRDLVANAVLLGASPAQTWTKIALPYSAVWIFTGLRIGLPYALIGAIVGEFVASDRGVGYRIKEATSYFDTSAVFAGIVVLMAISTFLLTGLRLIERHVLRWQTIDLASTREH